MEELLELEKRKKAIEDEISSSLGFLNESGMPGLHGPLVDAEGFPRSDVDVYAVRTARHKIACLKTDYQEISKEMESALQLLHASSRVAVERAKVPRVDVEVPQSSFAIVQEVSHCSPADEAGLKPGDAVIAFGSVSLEGRTVQQCFEELPNIVKENSSLIVRVLRDESYLDLTLQPHSWSGRGLLGCHIKPNML